MLLRSLMSSEKSLLGLFSSINLSSGLANLLLNVLPLLCLSLCCHLAWVSFFSSSNKRHFSTSLQLKQFWDINCFSSYICEIHCKFGTGCNKCMMSSSTGKWWDFSWNCYCHITGQMYRGSSMSLNLPFWWISEPVGSSSSVLVIVQHVTDWGLQHLNIRRQQNVCRSR